MKTKPRRSSSRNPSFGVSPEGTLLEFAVDLSTDFGFAYERFLNFKKISHSHERFVFCTARNGTRFEVTELATGKRHLNSMETTVFKAPQVLHSLKCKQTIYENLVFLPTRSRVKSTFEERGYLPYQWNELNSGIKEVVRTPWFNALVDRYFSLRIFSSSDQISLRFVEDELLREILSLVLGPPARQAQEALETKRLTPVPTSPIKRALEIIELSLFGDLNLAGVAKSSGMGRATLLRLFHKEMKMSPMAYVRERRLEEGKRLLEKSDHSVTEVSFLVGYQNTSAFCRAYKARYGVSPSRDESDTLRIQRK